MKHKKRELDSVTPNLTLSPEDIANIKHVMTDKNYTKEIFRQYDSERDEELEETKKTMSGYQGIILSNMTQSVLFYFLIEC